MEVYHRHGALSGFGAWRFADSKSAVLLPAQCFNNCVTALPNVLPISNDAVVRRHKPGASCNNTGELERLRPVSKDPRMTDHGWYRTRVGTALLGGA